MSSELPEGWQLSPLHNLAGHIARGATPSYASESTSIWAVSQKCVRDGKFDLSECRPHDSTKGVKSTAYLQTGDICINSTGTGTLGRAALWEERAEGHFVDTHVTIVRPDRQRVDPMFLAAFLGMPSTRETIYRECVTGSTNQIELSKSALRELLCPTPPLDEQQRIADVLRSVDHALRAQATLHSQTTIVLQSAREGLLATVRSDWPRRRFGDVARTFAGGTPPRSRADYYEGPIPWLKSGEVRGKRIFETEESITPTALKVTSARMAKAGSPVIAMYGATAGVVGMLDIDAAINQAVLAVEPHETLDSRFCVHVLEASGQRLLRTVQGSGQPNLSKRIIDDLEISLPPLHTQRVIADSLDSVEDTLADHQSTLSGLMRLKARLATDLLSGRIRVPA